MADSENKLHHHPLLSFALLDDAGDYLLLTEVGNSKAISDKEATSGSGSGATAVRRKEAMSDVM